MKEKIEAIGRFWSYIRSQVTFKRASKQNYRFIFIEIGRSRYSAKYQKYHLSWKRGEREFMNLKHEELQLEDLVHNADFS